jgi:multiple sugar transport system substrate-binding protein
MLKKLVYALLVTVLLLSACAPAAMPPTAAPATSAPASAAPAAAVEITYMMWGSPEELAVWQKIVDDFQAINPNIKVKVDVADWTGYWEKLKTLYAGNTPPDVFAMDGPLFPDWQTRGVLLNLQPYLDATPGFLDGFYPVTLQNYKLADGYYGLPRDFQTIVMFYNKDMFDKAGVAYPKPDWTIADFREAAKKLTLDTNGDGKIEQWGFDSDVWDMELFWSEAVWGQGGDIINADHTKTLLGEPKARQAFQLISDLIKVDKSMPTPETAAQYGGDLFQAGVAAMWPMGHWAVPQYAAVNFKYDIAPMPTGPAGRATSVNSAGFVVAKDSKHPKEAWEFIKFALSEAGQKRLAELGFAIPVLKSVAESPSYLKQAGPAINQQVFLDALQYAHVKPSFKGYDQWSTVVGDGLAPAWNGEKDINAVLDEIVPAADAVLAQSK